MYRFNILCTGILVQIYLFSGDPLSNMQIEFTNKEDAEAYCIQNGMVFLLIRCKTPKYSMG